MGSFLRRGARLMIATEDGRAVLLMISHDWVAKGSVTEKKTLV